MGSKTLNFMSITHCATSTVDAPCVTAYPLLSEFLPSRAPAFTATVSVNSFVLSFDSGYPYSTTFGTLRSNFGEVGSEVSAAGKARLDSAGVNALGITINSIKINADPLYFVFVVTIGGATETYGELVFASRSDTEVFASSLRVFFL